RRLAAAAIPHAHAAGFPPLLRGVLAADGLLAAFAGDPGAGDQLREAARRPGFAGTPYSYKSPETALALWHLWRGEPGQAPDLLQAVMTLAERTGSGECVSNANVALADVEWRAGKWAAAAAHAQAAARWNRESGRGRQGNVEFAMSLVKAGYGDVESARALAA